MPESKQIVQYLDIDIKDTRFFMSINQEGVHSYLMFGTYNRGLVTNILAKAGKLGLAPEKNEAIQDQAGTKNKRHKRPPLYSKLFTACTTGFRSELALEAINKESHSKPMFYQAYDISYDQYVDFLRIFESNHPGKQGFGCYKPISSLSESVIRFEYTLEPIYEDLASNVELLYSASILTARNTCRDTAIKFAETVTHEPLPDSISSQYFVKLPYQTYMDFGAPSKLIPFYVLPPPPNSISEISAPQKKIVEALYTRLERLAHTRADSSLTHAKFSSLKNLYYQLVTEKKEIDVSSLYHFIEEWHTTNASKLNPLRSRYFFDSFITRKSATQKLLEGFEKQLESTIAPQSGAFDDHTQPSIPGF